MNKGYNENLKVYIRDNFTCVYCGFDGRTFDNWLQLSIDHVHPSSKGGPDINENKVVACGSCNTLSCRWAPKDGNSSVPEMIIEKRVYLVERRKFWEGLWKEAMKESRLPDASAMMSLIELEELKQVAFNPAR